MEVYDEDSDEDFDDNDVDINLRWIALESILRLVDSNTKFRPQPVIKRFNIWLMIQLADGNWVMLALGHPKTSQVAMGLKEIRIFTNI